MVKGVNKQIIEINDTGNKYFEKVLLFVSPGKKDLPSELIETKAREYVMDFSKNFQGTITLRERMRKKRAQRRAFIIAGVLAFLAIGAAVIIKIL